MKFLQAPNGGGTYQIVFLCSIIIIFLFIKFYGKGKVKQKEKLSSGLKFIYNEALKGNDKRYALECGRRYYASLRPLGELTIYDETAITNDLAAMDVKDN
jgi:hypothetical protein